MASLAAASEGVVKPNGSGAPSVGGGESVTKRLQQELMGLSEFRTRGRGRREGRKGEGEASVEERSDK